MSQVHPSKVSNCFAQDIIFYLITTIYPAFDFNSNLLPLIIFNQANKFNFAQETTFMYVRILPRFVSSPCYRLHKNRNVIYATRTKKNPSHCLALVIT